MLHDVQLNRKSFDVVLAERYANRPALPVAVAWPCDKVSLGGALQAAEMGFISPTLIGDVSLMQQVAASIGKTLDNAKVVHVDYDVEAAEIAVSLARDGLVAAIMKGSLHTDHLMSAVVSKAGGLRTSRRISHVFVMDPPTYHKPLLVTDAAINIMPDLMVKKDIVQNAIDMAQKLGIQRPKVAILSAVEMVNPSIPSTIEAAALCKMADRGQIKGADLDGPLAFDNAMSKEAADIKGIKSVVVGNPDVLLVPNLETGNVLAKELEWAGHALGAGIVLGARVPIILTSRADAERARIASCLLALAWAYGMDTPAKVQGTLPIAA